MIAPGQKWIGTRFARGILRSNAARHFLTVYAQGDRPTPTLQPDAVQPLIPNLQPALPFLPCKTMACDAALAFFVEQERHIGERDDRINAPQDGLPIEIRVLTQPLTGSEAKRAPSVNSRF